MPTRDSLLTYYLDTPRFHQLCDRFGDYLNTMSAIDKFDLIGTLAYWQAFDTQVQSNGDATVPLEHYLQLTDLPIQQDSPALEALQLLDGCSDGEAIALITALINQIHEGVYQS